MIAYCKYTHCIYLRIASLAVLSTVQTSLSSVKCTKWERFGESGLATKQGNVSER